MEAIKRIKVTAYYDSYCKKYTFQICLYDGEPNKLGTNAEFIMASARDLINQENFVSLILSTTGLVFRPDLTNTSWLEYLNSIIER